MKTLETLDFLAKQLGGEEVSVVYWRRGEQVESFVVDDTGYYLDGRLPDEAADPDNRAVFRRWVVGDFLGSNYQEAAERLRVLFRRVSR